MNLCNGLDLIMVSTRHKYLPYYLSVYCQCEGGVKLMTVIGLPRYGNPFSIILWIWTHPAAV